MVVNFCKDALDLQMLVIRIVSQTETPSGCMRNFSTFALIHINSRNYLTQEKLKKMVFINYKMRMKVKNL